jgi:hypothetical protein
MKRLVLTSAALFCCLSLAAGAFAQATKTPVKKDVKPAAAPAAVSPELMQARMRPAVKGTAFIEIIKGTSKVVGGDIVSTLKVKNVSNGPIIGLKADEFFYAGQKEVSAGTARVRHPVAAGEVIEMQVSSPAKPGITSSQMMFTHAQGTGKVDVKSVKKFTEDAKKK